MLEYSKLDFSKHDRPAPEEPSMTASIAPTGPYTVVVHRAEESGLPDPIRGWYSPVETVVDTLAEAHEFGQKALLRYLEAARYGVYAPLPEVEDEADEAGLLVVEQRRTREQVEFVAARLKRKRVFSPDRRKALRLEWKKAFDVIPLGHVLGD